MSGWKASDMPELSGKVAVVTGANSGLGFETAKALALKDAHVVLACRNLEKAETAQTALWQVAPHAAIDIKQLDLADLRSVQTFSREFKQHFHRLDMLFNNAGVMALPTRQLTADGFEMQFGTNHLGHFALTGHLLPLLLETPESRVVTTSSIAYRMGRMQFSNLNAENTYQRWMAYGQSKLANLIFALELDRLLRRKNLRMLSLAAHPGYSHTHLQDTMTGPFYSFVLSLWDRYLEHPPAQGALPQLYAATMPDVRGGDFWGPNERFGLRGMPKRLPAVAKAVYAPTAKRLWRVSESLTGVFYEALGTSPLSK